MSAATWSVPRVSQETMTSRRSTTSGSSPSATATFIKNQQTEFSAEVGPGYRRADPRAFAVTAGDPPVTTIVDPDVEGKVVARGLIAYKHKFTDTTALENTTLVEAGSSKHVPAERHRASP